MSNEIREMIDKVKNFGKSINENVKPERTAYDGYSVGQVIISDGNEPYTGGNVFPIKGKKYQLIQKKLSDFKFPLTRETVYNSQGMEYKREEDYRLDKMKEEFDETPPIPEEDDGMHRLVIANELGYKTILMWIKI